MQKPNSYDETAAFGEFKPLNPGGHLLVIKSVQETRNRNGGDMLVINFDTAPDDSQPGYYADQWRNDNRSDKKWRGAAYQNVLDREGKTARGFKTFCTSVEMSNPNFKVIWGDKFAESFKNKKIGGVFRREQYLGSDGEAHWSVKLTTFRTVKAIMDGVEVPEDKYLGQTPVQNAVNQFQQNFQPVTGPDDDLPF